MKLYSHFGRKCSVVYKCGMAILVVCGIVGGVKIWVDTFEKIRSLGPRVQMNFSCE